MVTDGDTGNGETRTHGARPRTHTLTHASKLQRREGEKYFFVCVIARIKPGQVQVCARAKIELVQTVIFLPSFRNLSFKTRIFKKNMNHCSFSFPFTSRKR